jgi:hypothetical protein
MECVSPFAPVIPDFAGLVAPRANLYPADYFICGMG